MTVERKIVVGLDDVKGITLACSRCDYRITISPETDIELPRNCPRNHRWVIGEPSGSDPRKSPFNGLIASIRMIRELIPQNTLGVRILLEFDEPTR
jgi:hypothetical protein